MAITGVATPRYAASYGIDRRGADRIVDTHEPAIKRWSRRTACALIGGSSTILWLGLVLLVR